LPRSTAFFVGSPVYNFVLFPDTLPGPPPAPSRSGLRRQLGLSAVAALVVGDMLGTGVFFTPGEVASVAQSPWQVYLLWGLCGAITLCGALTLAELTTLLPRAGASYHIIREGFGPFPAFLKIWIEMWVSGPGSVAGVAIVLGEFMAERPIAPAGVPAAAWGALAIAIFSIVNLCGVRWGSRTQIVLTVVKIVGILALIVGSLALVAPEAPGRVAAAGRETGLLGLLSVVGLGVAAVLFTYDGWVDVTHVAGELRDPARHLPLALGLGVGGLTLFYLVVNYAYLRVVPLDAMRGLPTTAVAGTVAVAAFGPRGGQVLNVLIIFSILGALGGLILTLPRLFYAAAEQYRDATAPRRVSLFFRALAWVPAKSAVPAGAVIFTAALSITALVFFGTFRRIVTYFVVPVHCVNILLVASVFRLRGRRHDAAAYRAPGYPLVPAVYVFVLALFLLAAIAYNPRDTLIGMAMTSTALPFYWWIRAQGRP
jgi:basic amino acid/polyamine antiporter, APA family